MAPVLGAPVLFEEEPRSQIMAPVLHEKFKNKLFFVVQNRSFLFVDVFGSSSIREQ